MVFMYSSIKLFIRISRILLQYNNSSKTLILNWKTTLKLLIIAKRQSHFPPQWILVVCLRSSSIDDGFFYLIYYVTCLAINTKKRKRKFHSLTSQLCPYLECVCFDVLSQISNVFRYIYTLRLMVSILFFVLYTDLYRFYIEIRARVIWDMHNTQTVKCYRNFCFGKFTFCVFIFFFCMRYTLNRDDHIHTKQCLVVMTIHSFARSWNWWEHFQSTVKKKLVEHTDKWLQKLKSPLEWFKTTRCIDSRIMYYYFYIIPLVWFSTYETDSVCIRLPHNIRIRKLLWIIVIKLILNDDCGLD